MSNIPVKDIADLLDIVSDKLPDLVANLFKTLYSKEAGTEMGKAVGGLYAELVNAGLPPDAALKMATEYMFSLKDVLQKSGSPLMTYTSTT